MGEDVLKRIEKLEYHLELLLRLVSPSGHGFTKLIIAKGLSREDVQRFHHLCDELNNKMQEQKAEGFLYFLPLFEEFSKRLDSRLEAKEIVQACLEEKMHVELMSEFNKYLGA